VRSNADGTASAPPSDQFGEPRSLGCVVLRARQRQAPRQVVPQDRRVRMPPTPAPIRTEPPRTTEPGPRDLLTTCGHIRRSRHFHSSLETCATLAWGHEDRVRGPSPMPPLPLGRSRRVVCRTLHPWRRCIACTTRRHRGQGRAISDRRCERLVASQGTAGRDRRGGARRSAVRLPATASRTAFAGCASCSVVLPMV
jgi:hypothetical protein